MNAGQSRSFRFATPAQWDSCLFVQVDGQTLRARGAIQPLPAYERTATPFESSGGHAPVVTRTREILWRDDRGCLHRFGACDDEPSITAAPSAIGAAQRLVATAGALWVAGEPPDVLQRYEDDTLARVITVDLPGARVLDLVAGPRDSVLALITREGLHQIVRIDAAGHLLATLTLAGIAAPQAFVLLRSVQRLVILAGDPHQHLYWFAWGEAPTGTASEERRPLHSRPVAAMHPCFRADVLGSDGRERIFVGGADGDAFGGRAYVLVLDADGHSLGEVPLDPRDAPATGVAATRDALLVTGRRGLLRFAVADRVPDGAQQARCILMTPVLEAPDREDGRRWLRIEASASLPEGSTLSVAVAATDEGDVRDRLHGIATDRANAPSQRIAAMLEEPDVWHAATEFRGSPVVTAGEPDPFSAKLFDVTARYVWVGVTLTAAAGARLPQLSKLEVLYPGRTLMENLPAIYQREEVRPDSFLRSLVGVLETTTQGLDARIGSMGSHLMPATAAAPWLDFLARWLGVPWDDELGVEQKRRILARAASLSAARGTRAGLDTLLDGLFPGTPRRFRITDATADFGFATVGGDGCPGSALPAMLGGRTQWGQALGERTVLGCMRLPCPGEIDDGVRHLAGRIRIDIAATAAERRTWEPWLAGVISDIVPVTARVVLRWVSAQALRGDRLDGTVTLERPPVPHLGAGAVTSVARLPERGARMSGSGAVISTRLR